MNFRVEKKALSFKPEVQCWSSEIGQKATKKATLVRSLGPRCPRGPRADGTRTFLIDRCSMSTIPFSALFSARLFRLDLYMA